MTQQADSRRTPIAVMVSLTVLLAVPGLLSAATCAAPVPYDDLAGREIYCSFMQAVDDAGLMEPCGGRYFCPYELVPREDMALFIEQGLEGKWPGTQHEIGTPSGLFSGDVPVTYGLAPWIEQLGVDGIAAGCETTPPTPPKFCPYNLVTRAEMAVFISRAMVWTPTGLGTIPVSGTFSGQPYNCVAGGTSVFSDVAPAHWSCKYVHYMALTGVTSGCGATTFCPNDPTPRWQMAVFVSRAFGL